jgi:putative toxin-antitoxin system antitoxin component (TIGR02293 family)
LKEAHFFFISDKVIVSFVGKKFLIRQNIRIFGENVVMRKEVKKVSKVQEPAVAYKAKKSDTAHSLKKVPSHSLKVITREDDNSVNYWLGRQFISTLLRSDFDLITISGEGIPKASIDKLAAHLGISRKVMAEDILDLSVKTLERKALSDKLDRRTSSHAIEIAKVLQHAYLVFEDEEKLRRWIHKENRSLNGMKPLALFATLTGLNMVNDVLGRIEEGVYS